MNPTDWHDISWPLLPGSTTWPGAPPISLVERRSVASGDSTTDTVLTMDLHTGTHIEAARHLDAAGATVDQLPIESMIGPAVVVDVADASALAGAGLAELVPTGTTRLLLRTANSLHDPRASFEPDFPALDIGSATALAELSLLLVGIDYLSVQRSAAPPETHAVLFAAGVTILEGLRLGHVAPGQYDLVCLALRLPGREAAPARAFLAPAGTLGTPA